MEKKLKDFKFSRRIDFVKEYLSNYEDEKLVKDVVVKYNEVKKMLTYEFKFKKDNEEKLCYVSEKFTIIFDCFAIKQSIYVSKSDGTQRTIDESIFIEYDNITNCEKDLNYRKEYLNFFG